jgi:threonine/homoserine/homoserine lactone efflux protein
MDLSLPHTITILSIFSLAIISPGPNFILVLNSSLLQSTKVGAFTAIGVATGSGIFALSGTFGVLIVITSIPYFALAIKWIGGGYLIYLGVTMLRQKSNQEGITKEGAVRLKPAEAFSRGLGTNLTNPKAWAFYLSLFTIIIPPEISLFDKVVLTASMFFISLCWYSAVALLISHSKFQSKFQRHQTTLQTLFGLMLLILGGTIFFQNS